MSDFLHLFIINPDELCEKALATVDTFETFAKVLSLSERSNRYESTLAASFEILKRLADVPKDMNGLLTKLEQFTLDVADECFHRLGRNPMQVREMPSLTPRQDLAMDVTKTLKSNRVKEITKLNWMLLRKVKKHENSLIKLIDSQEKLAMVNSGMDDNMESYDTLHSQLDEPKHSLLYLIQRMFGLRTKLNLLEIDRNKNDKKFRMYLEKVHNAENAMLQVSDDILLFTRKCIKRRFESGIAHLQKVINTIVRKERQQPLKDLLSSIIPEEETENLIASACKSYHYPNITALLMESDDILPPSTYVYPETFYSKTLKEEVLIKGLNQRLPTGPFKMTLKLRQSRSQNLNKVVEVYKTSVADTSLVFGWSPLHYGPKSSVKKWGFFRAP